MTSPSSVAKGLSDDASVKKAGRRGTKSATAPRAPSVQRGGIVFVIIICINRTKFFLICGHACVC